MSEPRKFSDVGSRAVVIISFILSIASVAVAVVALLIR